MEKKLIKKCGSCGFYYYADKPHFMKSANCKELQKIEENYRLQNSIPSYEVHHLTIDTQDFMIGFQYDEKQSMRNFMKLVAKKLDIF